MYMNINKKELQELTQHFYNITGILVNVYDQKENLICAYPKVMCRFCAEIRKHPELEKKCIENDEVAFKICKQTQQSYKYHCHMGLVEVATPIVYQDKILGYMLFGQITDYKNQNELFTKMKEYLQQYKLDQKYMKKSLKEIHYCSDEYLQSLVKLLEMCANYIWINSMICIRKEGLALEIDCYIREHMKEELSVSGVCRKFGIGKSTLYEISKNNFGCGIGEYIQQLRNERAKELLKDKNVRVSEIAENVGIRDVNYFIRFFKKRNQCTPKEYQKQFSK